MRTIETTAKITADGELILHLQSLLNLAPGHHRVVLVIDETPTPPGDSLPPLQLETFAWPDCPPEATFGREELYDDNGR
jgi:hypothetical protein